MTWETDNPAAVIDVGCVPSAVVTRYATVPEAEWYLDYLWEHGGSATQAKIDRGDYVISVIAPENSPKRRSEKVAQPRPMDYNRGNAKPPVRNPRKAIAMPPRGRRAAAAPVEPEVEEVEENPFERHLTKELSPTMQDYAEWFEQEVASFDDVEPDRLLALGSTLYPHFQKSEMNQKRREARRSQRAVAPVDEPEEEEEAPAPARKGRTVAKTAPAKAAATEPAAAKPAAPARTTRSRRAAATSDAAPY